VIEVRLRSDGLARLQTVSESVDHCSPCIVQRLILSQTTKDICQPVSQVCADMTNDRHVSNALR
jgi:hypothetical protein